MRRPTFWLVVGLGGLLSGCATSRPLTVDEHRAAALEHEKEALTESARYDPKAKAYGTPARSPFDEASGPSLPLSSYNPTEGHLATAERHLKAAAEHLASARDLERFEDQACRAIPPAVRAACPLLTPYTALVEETARGVRLHLKADAPGKELAARMQCHLAFAHAKGFTSPACPLYVPGVSVTLLDGNVIDVGATAPERAVEIRRQARAMFVANLSTSLR